MRRVLALVALTVAALALAACATIPSSGSVHEGVKGQSTTSDDLQFLPSGPIKDATAAEILRGFIDAGTSPANDYGVAREFLASSYQADWAPLAVVSIDNGQREVRQLSSASFALITTVVARVDARGTYQAQSPTRQQFNFSLVQEAGQWRISTPTPGVIVNTGVFAQTYSQSPLYFYNQNFVQLVPDVRWFPARSSTSTRVVKALLGGPVDWLAEANAVRSAIPAGAGLVADSVPLESGVATVDLDAKSFADSTIPVDTVARQIAASLSSVSGVSRVRILYSGAPQATVDVPSQSSLQANPRLTEPVVLTARSLGVVSDSGIVPLAPMGRVVAGLKPNAVAISSDHQLALAVTSSGAVAVNVRGETRPVDARKGLIAPTVDPAQFMWSVPRQAPTALAISAWGGSAKALAVPWQSAESIDALAVSPDGTRLVASYRASGHSAVCIAGIQRAAKGAPTSIGPCLNPYLEVASVTTVGWIDYSHVGIASTVGDNSILSTLCIGGLTTQIPVSGRIAAVGGSGSYGVARLATRAGNVLQQLSATRWYLVTSGVVALANVG